MPGTCRQPGIWAVNQQGELFPAKAGRSLFTKQRYCDFVLEADFKLGAKRKANSGVFIRVHNRDDEVNTGMEIQILDNGDYGVPFDAGNANGALYDLVRPAVDANRPIGQWNHYRITANDNLIVVELNGKEIVRADLNRWTTAHQNPDGGTQQVPLRDRLAAAGRLHRPAKLRRHPGLVPQREDQDAYRSQTAVHGPGTDRAGAAEVDEE